MAQANYEQIKYEVQDNILTITLNRPDKMNAFTHVMMDELISAFDAADADDNVRAIDHLPGSGLAVATARGISRLRARMMTLADKARHYQRILRARHVRPPGLVEKCRLEHPGNLAGLDDQGRPTSAAP